MITKEKPYVKALDAMRAIAISAVVLAHTTTRTIEASKDNLAAFPWTLFLNQIARFAVPLFFMVSGFSLELNYPNHSNYFSFLKKRLGKIFIPYVFWSAIYYFFIYNQNHDNFLKVLYLGNASYQLYFIPALFIFYILFPLIHNLYDFLANKWVLLVLAYSQMAFLHHDYFVKPYKLNDPIHTALMCYFVFILGMVAARNIDAIFEFAKKTKYYLAALTVLSAFYIFWEGMTNFINTGNYLTFYSNFRPSTLVYAILLALFLFYEFDKEHLTVSPRKKLSDSSFFVFFIHVIILENVWKFFGKQAFESFGGTVWGKTFFDPVFFGIVIGISFLLAIIIRKIPFASKITG
ncbi:MAG TPA: acyltransferase [Patescibacteria group bacterium]|nr:acyltransferase [Patescibacteria group bacterium]